jgi:hypothetical protein
MEKKSSIPYFYINPSIPSYSGKEPLRKTILTDHQRRILYYIRLLESENPIPILSSSDSQNLYFHTNYAFYADPICTGKSFVILSLLSLHRVLERKKLLTIWSNGLGMNVFSKIQNFEIPMSFLVVPHSSLSQWETLFKEETDILYFIVDSDSSIESINTYQYEVLIISDSVFDKVCHHFEGFSVSRLIFDDLLHLEIKNIHKKDIHESSNIRGQFGDLRASFTWFICSDPYECLQKYKNSNLPFAVLIKQIFTFPYSGLIFGSEKSALEVSLSKILPPLENLNIVKQSVYLDNPNSSNILQEMDDIFCGKDFNLIYSHLIHLFQQKEFTSFENTSIDPLIKQYPIFLDCCHQNSDLVTISNLLRSQESTPAKCPNCLKEISWTNCKFIQDKKPHNILNYLESIDKNQYNILYIPTLHRSSKIQKSSRVKLHKIVQFLSPSPKCYSYFGKSNDKKMFDLFKKEKGILIINRPIESNLHLSFVDKIIVVYPKEYTCQIGKVWYSEYFQKYFSFDRNNLPLSDKEFGNFVIGRSNNQTLKIDFLSLF